jgi:hypothetical protein
MVLFAQIPFLWYMADLPNRWIPGIKIGFLCPDFGLPFFLVAPATIVSLCNEPPPPSSSSSIKL